MALSLLLSLSGCSTGAPPPPPPRSDSASDDKGERRSGERDRRARDEEEEDERPSKKKKSSSRDEEEEEEEEEEEDEDSGSSGGGSTRGGAAIGDEDTQKAVKACHGKGKAFDRFSSDTGECTSINLAKMTCSEEGIRKVLSESQKRAFDDALNGGYSGWILDQCVDCPKGSGAKVCTSSGGAEQVGTKIFFVQEDADQIKGKAMVLPVRPGQTSSKATDDE